MKTLRDLFLNDLAEIYDAELRIANGLPRMARTASSEKLKDALLFHLKETKWHITRIEQTFDCFGATVMRKTCKAVVGMLQECDNHAAGFIGTPAINAALIGAARKLEHYEMTSFGCLHEWAERLENSDAAEIFRDLLDDARATDDKLTDLALSGINEEALAPMELCR